MGLTHEQIACVADPERIWQVRRLCQVRYATTAASWTGHPPSQAAYGSDPALSALLRCLLYELQADTGAISLLDDEDQHFLSVAHAADSDNPDIRRADWFGCEQIPIRGGICERTIAQEYPSDDYPVYEILDLKADESTCSLPVVDGRTASFGYYAGVPLTTKDGLNVGALFVFKKDPQTEPLAMAKRRCLAGTAQHVIDQMMRTVAALENSWSLRCSLAVTSITHSEEENYSPSGPVGTVHQAENIPSSPSQLFELAARQLSHSLDLESVTLQELPRSDTTVRVDVSAKEAMCAGYTSNLDQPARPVDDALATQLWEAFPSGAVLQLDTSEHGGTFLVSATDDPRPRQRLKISLCDHFPGIQQCVFMPLRDTFHDRDTAFIFGWTSDRKRVYSSMTDLPSLSSFGIAVMTQLRRLQAQVLSRKKADFLASVSHEMRSPLHGLLACIASLNDTECTAAQVDLLETAEACGLQLQNNIDNVLQYSKIGTASRNQCNSLEQSSASIQTSLAPSPEPDQAVHGRSDMVTFVEDAVEKLARKHQILKSLQVHELSTQPSDPTITSNLYRDGENPLITFDAARGADFAMSNITETRLIIDNLLDNCLKFTSAGGCIRIQIEASDETVRMLFTDSGRGMPPDFARYGALEPFTQQDPLDDGIGLGLSLVRNAVQALNGKMSLDTDTQTGTRLSINLPWSQLTIRPGSTLAESLQDLTKTNGAEHPVGRTAWLFEPGQWKDPYNARHTHSRRTLSDSLSCSLRSWLNTDLEPWRAIEQLPTYFFAFHTDLDAMREEIGPAFEQSRKIIICPNSHTQSTLSPADIGVFATLTSPLTPSKLRAAISAVDQNSQQQSATSSTCQDRMILDAQQTTLESNPVPIEALTISGESRKYSTTSAVKCDEPAQVHIEHALVAEHAPALHPKLLLVDDNAINLRVVGMYAKKCSKGPYVLAGGGQQAIDLYNDESNETSSGFDIIFLDLSMPEVSGFDVAAAIRSTERSHPCRARTYIAALTGLVSDKDRRAAFEAGVDEYITKPATIKDFQSVIANWKIANGA